DGTLTFEYRFTPTEEKTGYNAAVSIRRSAESSGCKVALGDDCGALSVSFVSASDREKTVQTKPADKFAKPIGDWNTVEIKTIGRSVEVIINGRTTASFDNANERGLIGLHAEGSAIEFREVIWREAGREPDSSRHGAECSRPGSVLLLSGNLLQCPLDYFLLALAVTLLAGLQQGFPG